MPNVWGDIATWVSAIAALFSVTLTCLNGPVTCCASIAAWIAGIGLFVQIRNEQNERKKSEDEKKVKEKRNQAEQVVIWASGKDSNGNINEIVIDNQSSQPIYNLVVVITIMELNNGKAENNEKNNKVQEIIDITPPGYWYISIHGLNGGDLKPIEIEAAFQDMKGVYWLRKTNGALLEINTSPKQHYNIHGPYRSPTLNHESQSEITRKYREEQRQEYIARRR
jgi:hypothetical protein